MAISLKSQLSNSELLKEVIYHAPVFDRHYYDKQSHSQGREAGRRQFYDFYAMEYLWSQIGAGAGSKANRDRQAAASQKMASGTGNEDDYFYALNYPKYAGTSMWHPEIPNAVVLPHKLENAVNDLYEQVTRATAKNLMAYVRMAVVQEFQYLINMGYGWAQFRMALIAHYNKNKTVSKEDFNKLIKQHIPEMAPHPDVVKKLLKFSKYYSSITTSDHKDAYDVARPAVPKKPAADNTPISDLPDPENGPNQPSTPEPDDDETDYNAEIPGREFGQYGGPGQPEAPYDKDWSGNSAFNDAGEPPTIGGEETDDDDETPEAEKQPLNEEDINPDKVRKVYRAINKAGITLEDIIKAYTKIPWSGAYGGPKWGAGAIALLKLYDAKKNLSTEDMNHIIDHIYDLQHNTGSLLNKGPMFVTDTDLNRRYKISNVARFIPFVSPIVKNFIIRYLRYLTPENPAKAEEEANMESMMKMPSAPLTPEEVKPLQELGFKPSDDNSYRVGIKFKNKAGEEVGGVYYEIKKHNVSGPTTDAAAPNKIKYIVSDNLKADIRSFDTFDEAFKYLSLHKKDMNPSGSIGGSGWGGQTYTPPPQSEKAIYISSHTRVKLPPDKEQQLLNINIGWRKSSKYYKGYFSNTVRFLLYAFSDGTFLTTKNNSEEFKKFSSFEEAFYQSKLVMAEPHAQVYPDKALAQGEIDAIKSGKSPSAATPTASGKTYFLPSNEALETVELVKSMSTADTQYELSPETFDGMAIIQSVTKKGKQKLFAVGTTVDSSIGKPYKVTHWINNTVAESWPFKDWSSTHNFIKVFIKGLLNYGLPSPIAVAQHPAYSQTLGSQNQAAPGSKPLPPNATSKAAYTAHVGIDKAPKSTIRLTKEDEEALKAIGFDPKIIGDDVWYIHKFAGDTVKFFPNGIAKLLITSKGGGNLKAPVVNYKTEEILKWLPTKYSLQTTKSPAITGASVPPAQMSGGGPEKGIKAGTMFEKTIADAGFIWDSMGNEYVDYPEGPGKYSNVLKIAPNRSSVITFSNGSKQNFKDLASLIAYIKTSYPAQKKSSPITGGITTAEYDAIEKVVSKHGQQYWTEYVIGVPGHSAYASVYKKISSKDNSALRFSIGHLGKDYQLLDGDNQPLSSLSEFDEILARLDNYLSKDTFPDYWPLAPGLLTDSLKKAGFKFIKTTGVNVNTGVSGWMFENDKKDQVAFMNDASSVVYLANSQKAGPNLTFTNTDDLITWLKKYAGDDSKKWPLPEGELTNVLKGGGFIFTGPSPDDGLVFDNAQHDRVIYYPDSGLSLVYANDATKPKADYKFNTPKELISWLKTNSYVNPSTAGLITLKEILAKAGFGYQDKINNGYYFLDPQGNSVHYYPKQDQADIIYKGIHSSVNGIGLLKFLNELVSQSLPQKSKRKIVDDLLTELFNIGALAVDGSKTVPNHMKIPAIKAIRNYMHSNLNLQAGLGNTKFVVENFPLFLKYVAANGLPPMVANIDDTANIILKWNVKDESQISASDTKKIEDFIKEHYPTISVKTTTEIDEARVSKPSMLILTDTTNGQKLHVIAKAKGKYFIYNKTVTKNNEKTQKTAWIPVLQLDSIDDVIKSIGETLNLKTGNQKGQLTNDEAEWIDAYVANNSEGLHTLHTGTMISVRDSKDTLMFYVFKNTGTAYQLRYFLAVSPSDGSVGDMFASDVQMFNTFADLAAAIENNFQTYIQKHVQSPPPPDEINIPSAELDALESKLQDYGFTKVVPLVDDSGMIVGDTYQHSQSGNTVSVMKDGSLLYKNFESGYPPESFSSIADLSQYIDDHYGNNGPNNLSSQEHSVSYFDDLKPLGKVHFRLKVEDEKLLNNIGFLWNTDHYVNTKTDDIIAFYNPNTDVGKTQPNVALYSGKHGNSWYSLDHLLKWAVEFAKSNTHPAFAPVKQPLTIPSQTTSSDSPFGNANYNENPTDEELTSIKLNSHDSILLSEIGFKFMDNLKLYVKDIDPNETPLLQEARKPKKPKKSKFKKHVAQQYNLPFDGQPDPDEKYECISVYNSGNALWTVTHDPYKAFMADDDTKSGTIKEILDFVWHRWDGKSKLDAATGLAKAAHFKATVKDDLTSKFEKLGFTPVNIPAQHKDEAYAYSMDVKDPSGTTFRHSVFVYPTGKLSYRKYFQLPLDVTWQEDTKAHFESDLHGGLEHLQTVINVSGPADEMAKKYDVSDHNYKTIDTDGIQTVVALNSQDTNALQNAGFKLSLDDGYPTYVKDDDQFTAYNDGTAHYKSDEENKHFSSVKNGLLFMLNDLPGIKSGAKEKPLAADTEMKLKATNFLPISMSKGSVLDMKGITHEWYNSLTKQLLQVYSNGETHELVFSELKKTFVPYAVYASIDNAAKSIYNEYGSAPQKNEAVISALKSMGFMETYKNDGGTSFTKVYKPRATNDTVIKYVVVLLSYGAMRYNETHFAGGADSLVDQWEKPVSDGLVTLTSKFANYKPTPKPKVKENVKAPVDIENQLKAYGFEFLDGFKIYIKSVQPDPKEQKITFDSFGNVSYTFVHKNNPVQYATSYGDGGNQLMSQVSKRNSKLGNVANTPNKYAADAAKKGIPYYASIVLDAEDTAKMESVGFKLQSVPPPADLGYTHAYAKGSKRVFFKANGTADYWKDEHGKTRTFPTIQSAIEYFLQYEKSVNEITYRDVMSAFLE